MKQVDRNSRPRYYHESGSEGSDYDEELAESSSSPEKPQENDLQMVLEGTINMIFERRGESAVNLKFIVNGDWSYDGE
jgi:hypothetical protein